MTPLNSWTPYHEFSITSVSAGAEWTWERRKTAGWTNQLHLKEEPNSDYYIFRELNLKSKYSWFWIMCTHLNWVIFTTSSKQRSLPVIHNLVDKQTDKETYFMDTSRYIQFITIAAENNRNNWEQLRTVKSCVNNFRLLKLLSSYNLNLIVCFTL